MRKQNIIKKLKNLTDEKTYNNGIYESKISQQYWEGYRNGLCFALDSENCTLKYRLPWER